MKDWLKRMFVPHEGNDYAPHSLQRVAVVGMVIMIIFSFTLANLQAVLWRMSDWMVSTILPAVIVQDTNTERAEGALGVLRRSSVLDAAAQMKAADMAQHGYFAHTSPTGVTPWYWFGQAGYNYVHAGENLAVHFTDSGEVVTAWMNSPTHRANIMDGQFTEIGIGVAEGEYEGFPTVFVVQLFGTPAAPVVAPQVAGEVALTPAEAVAAEPTPAATLAPTSSVTDTVKASSSDTVLASSLTLTEQVELVPAAPVAVVTTSTPTTSDVTDIAVTEHGVVAYTDTISTSSMGTTAGATPAAAEPVPLWARFATQPHVLLQVVYGFIALFVFVALTFSIVIEVRRQAPMQIVYSATLVGLMILLLYLHLALTTGAVIV